MAGDDGYAITRTDARLSPQALDGFLATKLYVPRSQPGSVPRRRLLDRLGDGLTRRLTVVSAPAGFGKTVLLAEWARHAVTPVAWLSLDTGDNDPARFWRHAVVALDRVVPGVAERVIPLIGSLDLTCDGLVTAVINEMATQTSDVALILDDYHLITLPAIHESVAFFVDHLPPNLHLVLASRTDPPLRLAALRARGQLAELRAADLRFTPGEAGALLHATAGADLPGDVTGALAAQTEGWAAGLHLAALSLQGQPEASNSLAAFSGTHRFVFDYLTEEVLDRQPEPVREFLLETSILDRLSGPVCDAVTGRDDSQQMLEAIERANLFLVPLDEVRGWWRYHHLFAELLRARLDQERPSRAQQLHQAASRWHDEQGLIEDAIRHAVAAGDTARAARLIERHFDALVLRGEGVTLQRWLAALPAEVTGVRPRLLLGQARLALLSGRTEGVEGLLNAAGRAFADATDEDYEPSVGRAASLLVNPPATLALAWGILAELRGDAEGAIEHAGRALDRVRDGEIALETITRGHVAVAEWLRGRLGDAERLMEARIARFEAAGEVNLAAWSSHYLGQVQRAQGRLDAASETYQRAMSVASVQGRPVLPGAGVAYVGLAEIAYQRGDTGGARRFAAEGIPLCRQLVYTQPLANGLATLAWIAHASGDAPGALAAMEEAARVAPGLDVANLLNTVPAQRAHLLLAQGNVSAAAEWVHQRGLTTGDDPGYAREPEHLILARVLLAQDRSDEASRFLGRLYDLAVSQQRTGSVIEIQALRALAYAASGDHATAIATLANALTLAAPQGYVRVFVNEGDSMRTLLSQVIAAQRTDHVAASVPLDYLARLSSFFEPEETPQFRRGKRGAAAGSGVLVALSDREREVLALLATGKQNREIADELYVALDTVKKHVTHIFAKIGATNRTEAIARARELGLLP